MGKKCIIGRFKIPAIILLGLVFISFAPLFSANGAIKNDKAGIVIGNNDFKYEIAADGRNLHFTDNATGADYLYPDSVSFCAYLMQEGKEYPVSAVSIKENLLMLEFKKAGVTAEILIYKGKDYVALEVVKVNGAAESLTFINVPLKIRGLPYEPFAACVLSMNLYTHVRQLPALQTHLWATCYKRFGMKGAKITLLGVPQENILPVIRDVMSHAKDIPHSDKGGAWAQLSKEGHGSYLMNFGSLREETVDEWIERCDNVGFNQIDNHGGGADFFKFGSFELNPEKWPDGWNHFKRINKRLHKAGISSIFHTYAFFIDKKSKYVTPVPSADLAYFRYFTLAEPVGPKDSVIVVKESTENISTTTGFFVPNSRTLRLGNELIEFSGATKSAPYQFTGCKRAVNGAKASAYKAEEKAYHLKEMFGLFVPDPESGLFKEIASHTAEIVNENNFDGIYLDAIDGSGILAGDENSWYYSTKFVVEIAKHLKRPVGMEMSAMEHQYWHYRARWQAWDTPLRGYKRFVDLHSEAINGGLLLPMHLGWWINSNWAPPQTETTFTDDIEYLCCKMIGNNAGLSMLGGVDKKTLDENPSFRRLNTIIKQYEELRHKNYFGEDIKKLLRQPGKEFTLFKEENGSWNFKPVAYQKHKVAGTNHSSARWTVKNEFDSQPVRLRIEPLMSVKPYNDKDNIVLADFSIPEKFSNTGTANGVSGSINSSIEKTVSGEMGGIFSAFSSGVSPRNGSWISMEKKFEPWLNLDKNQALGVWIKGDGNGELLNFRIESPLHLAYGARGDHFVKIDFTGWRYFELIEIESTQFSDYIWTKGGDADLYNSYRNLVLFNKVDKLQLWYNNLPAGKEVSCVVGPVMAIPTVTGTIENPSITIGGEKIVFPVRMESGMYLEFRSSTDCKLYGSKGELLKEVTPIGKNPNLVNGQNEISFSCDGPKEISARVQVTVINDGKPLVKKVRVR
ncbi:MAG: hypothetical protein NTZ69_19050 [Bacteroidia bacterium]|nr:hypothetical protein [Bacteroidia bacterium]